MASSVTNRSKTSFSARSGSASCLSTLLSTTMGRSPSRSALASTNLVCGIGPSAASTSSSTPSTIERMRSTSPPKSAWPGVSTMLMRWPCHSTLVALARMVMPRSRSRSLESRARSTVAWLSRKAPDCLSSASTSVVLPWSTCAMMAMLRRSMRAVLIGYERRSGHIVPRVASAIGPAPAKRNRPPRRTRRRTRAKTARYLISIDYPDRIHALLTRRADPPGCLATARSGWRAGARPG